MKALVIYDATGRIYAIHYGEETAPLGIPSLCIEAGNADKLERIDVTDPANPQPVYKEVEDTVDVLEALETYKRRFEEIELVLSDLIGGA